MLTLMLLILIFVAIAFAAVWVKKSLFPDSPVVIEYLIWGFVIVCILILMLNALGVPIPRDPAVPKLR